MAVFIELTTDAFEERLREERGKKKLSNRSSRAGAPIARRPVRGLEIKDDTYAFLKVIQADGSEIPLLDSGASGGRAIGGTSNFILQTVDEARMEKHQIVETFGESYIFFFGEQPRFLDVQAVIINSHDFNWEAEWWENYNTYLRGTRLVEMGARSYLFYDDNVVEGYLLNAHAVKRSSEPFLIQLSFRFFVTNYTNISFIGDPHFPIRSSVAIPAGIDLTSGDAAADLLTSLRGDALTALQQKSFDTQHQIEQALAPQRTFVEDGKKLPPLPSPSFGEQRKLSAAVQQLSTPSIGLSSTTIGRIQSLADENLRDQLLGLMTRSGVPIRGLISDNKDEIIGGRDVSPLGPFTTRPIGLDTQEVDDLAQASLISLTCFGAQVNDNKSLLKIGLGPIFSKGRDGRVNFNPKNLIEVQGFSGLKKSLTPQFNAGAFGVVGTGVTGSSLTRTFGASAGAGAGFSIGGPTTALGRGTGQLGDPLNATFGPTNTGSRTFSADKFRFIEGAGDHEYGYHSDFASGPGFGGAGFHASFGGRGFGSGNSRGDPGFKDPSQFSFNGVAEEQEAFNRFNTPSQDPTILGGSLSAGAGLSAGTSGVTGGAVVLVPGKPSAFTIGSYPGTLDPTGQARQQPGAVSDLRQAQALGFSQGTPFGVQCPEPPGLHAGFHASFP